jgi:hypothetical protein
VGPDRVRRAAPEGLRRPVHLRGDVGGERRHLPAQVVVLWWGSVPCRLRNRDVECLRANAITGLRLRRGLRWGRGPDGRGRARRRRRGRPRPPRKR